MTDQPEALRVAHELECRALINEISLDDDFVMELDAARLLREQHAEIERLREQLRLANIDALNESAENAALRAEVLAEREACAKVCNDLVLAHPGRADLTAEQCAVAIRARGK